MMLYRSQKLLSLLLALALLALLAACGGGNVAQQGSQTSAKPAVDPGQPLLAQSSHLLKSAQTLHGIFNGSISGHLITGEMNSEIWRMAPHKSRTLILHSTLSQFTTGTLIVNDGHRIWQYDPVKHIVYTGPARVSDSHGTSVIGASQGNAQALFFSVLQTIFTGSTARLLSSNEHISGHQVDVIHVSPRPQSAASASLSYDGTVALDQQTRLPVLVNLALAGIGQVRISIPTLAINQTLDPRLFAYAPPGGVPQVPLPSEPSIQTSNSLTLQQAERQAHYHLLSIPGAQSAYKLQSIDALGAPGNEIYAFTYALNNQSFTVSESKSLADLHLKGPAVSLRSATATLATHGPTTTLSWTEQGVGIQISGALDKEQIVAAANLLK